MTYYGAEKVVPDYKMMGSAKAAITVTASAKVRSAPRPELTRPRASIQLIS
jgi:enoyl-[acyl-carrier-protein] reductase (NADH)